VFHNRQVRVKVQRQGQVTPYGGLSVAQEQAMRLEIDQDIHRSLHLLKHHMPYTESNHVLTLASSLL